MFHVHSSVDYEVTVLIMRHIAFKRVIYYSHSVNLSICLP